ncbi:helix-turn-helix domain-containing protein [Gimesia fumaroli]|uniref:Helix-turn-helix domain protein n=1 Tax=Gimesia fumaroli TaxID=2527976 RepID=A0A518I906_9PLAN|nr:helix-turn-helix transcriptional regulator [Gimesia fumaroli]QDV49595.1 Helix-turn-helix domain protein [Gimesia fumaroli]
MAVSSTAKKRAKSKMGRARKEIDDSTYQGRCAIRLRELADRKGITADELQQRLNQAGHNVSRNAVYSYLSGDRAIPLDLVPTLASIFGISVRTFFPEK